MDESNNLRTRKFLTRSTFIPLALVAFAVVIWFGAATFVTYRIMHPPFLDTGHGDVIIASEQARAAARLGTDPKSCCDAAFEDLQIGDAAGVSVDAWFVPGTLPSAVLLIPPSGASRRAMLPYLKFLHPVGLPVLMIDSSDIARGRAGWGWGERGIVRSAAEALRKRGYKEIAALGVAEGAATALMVQGETPDLFQAIIADSSFANLDAMLRRNPSLAGLNPAFLQTVMWDLGRVLGRSANDVSPEHGASKLGSCALLIVQNGKDPLTPMEDARRILVARANPSSVIYLTHSEGHGDAIYVDPEGYQRAVLEFIAHHLPGADAVASD